MNTNKNEVLISTEILALNFDRLKYKLQKEPHEADFSHDSLQLAEEEYRKFLMLIYLHPEKPIVPTKLVDQFWHQHILDTKAYSTDCQVVFGEFVHHFPYFGIYGTEDKVNLNNAFAETKRLYKAQFGQELESAYASRCEGHACHASTECACRVESACKSTN